MNGRNAAVALSLLCALFYSALETSSALALKGTTAYTCVSASGGAGFSDEHCTSAVGSGAIYQQQEIGTNFPTRVAVTNESTSELTKKSTNAVLSGNIAGLLFEVVCAKVASIEGLTDLENWEFGGEKQIRGAAEIVYSECTMPKPSSCKLPSGSLVVTAKAVAVVYKGKFGEEEMDVKFEPKFGSNFVEIGFEDNTEKKLKCALNGKKFPVTRMAVGKANGATLEFVAGGSFLVVANKPAAFTSKVTARMAPFPPFIGNPIFLATTGK